MTSPDNELEPILQSLRSKENRYQSELDELNGRRAGVMAKLDQIQAAIAALEGSSNAQGKAGALKSHPKKRRIPDQAYLESILDKIFLEKGNIKRHALEQLVKAKLLADGFSRMGLSKNLSDILARRSTAVDNPAPAQPTIS